MKDTSGADILKHWKVICDSQDPKWIEKFKKEILIERIDREKNLPKFTDINEQQDEIEFN